MNAFKPPRSEERVQGTKFLAGVWGKAPNVTPVTPNREAIKKQESGSEAKPDSANPASSRYPVTPKQESGSEAKPDSANPALNRHPVTPALGRAPQGG